MNIIGVDPGNNGGMAYCINGEAIEYQEITTVPEMVRFFFNANRMADGQPVAVIFEEHKGGKAGITSAAAHKSAGRYLGIVETLCAVYEMALTKVTPQTWKSHFGLINRTLKGEIKPSDKEKREIAKNASISLCKRLFPKADLLPTPRCKNDSDGIAEALLLCRYGEDNKKALGSIPKA